MTISQVSSIALQLQCIRAKLNVVVGPGGGGTARTKFAILSQRQKESAMKYAKHTMPETKTATNKSAYTTSAAVLVPICFVAGLPSILFTLRSKHVSTHKSEICFPGGHVEEFDESYACAALREAQEELGGTYNYEEGVEILGETEWVPSASGTPVIPVVAAFTEEFTDQHHVQRVFFNSCEGLEVEKVFTRTLDELMHSETYEHLPRLGTQSPIFPGREGKIWGLTAFILRPLLHEVICPAFQKQKKKSPSE